MIRKAFRMSVHPGRQAEYETRNSPIWPELEATLVAHGVRQYSIFLDPITRDLFAYAEIDSEERWQAIAATDVCRRWWASMRELMPSNPDHSSVSRDLREVFHIPGETAAERPKRGQASVSHDGASPLGPRRPPVTRSMGHRHRRSMVGASPGGRQGSRRP